MSPVCEPVIPGVYSHSMKQLWYVFLQPNQFDPRGERVTLDPIPLVLHNPLRTMHFTKLHTVSPQKLRNTSFFSLARAVRSRRHIKTRGFTIVELLIVIVVIGILAAIVIVAYNGVQQRARDATVRADMANSAKKMAIDNTLNGSYALTAAAVDSGKGLPASTGTTYQFHSTGTTYCITGTNGTASYMISDTATTPTAGGCAGDGTGGVAAVTNLMTNPSAENDASGMWANTASPTIAQSNVQAKFGTYSYALTSTTVSPDDAGLIQPTVQPGTYTLSYSYFTPVSRSVYFDECNSTSGGCTSQSGLQTVAANTWTRIVATFTVGGTGAQSLSIYLHGTNGPNSSGNTIYIDGLMLTAGSSTYNYADGNSPSWIWNGSANSATSTGPPQ